MAELIPYPETLDLRRLTRDVHKHRPEIKRVAFTGTVKVHGTNITVVFQRDHSPQIQSRNRIITAASPTTDNSGAAAFLTPWLGKLRMQIERAVGQQYPGWNEVMVAGEYAGQGIQKGVGVSGLERFYVIFGVRVDGRWMPEGTWRDVKVEPGHIFNIFDFQTFRVTIDFTSRWRRSEERTPRETAGHEEDACAENLDGLATLRPDVDGEFNETELEDGNTFAANSEVERLTQAVENECPVALKVGGVRNGVGEGIVWVEESLVPLENPLRFKSKGPKHRAVGRKILQKQGATDDAKTERVGKFVAYAVTDMRLEQGLASLTEQDGGESDVMMLLLDKRNIPKLHKWVMADVVKEEGDVMQEMGLTEKEVKAEVVKRVRDFFERGVEEASGNDL